MVGDNVLLVDGRKTFLGQLFKVQGDRYRYHVYFVGNGDVDVVGLDQLKSEPDPSRNRRDYLGKEFYFDGTDDLASGRFKARRLVEDRNEFVCTRLTGRWNIQLSERREF